jgi:hypothetical protein
MLKHHQTGFCLFLLLPTEGVSHAHHRTGRGSPLETQKRAKWFLFTFFILQWLSFFPQADFYDGEGFVPSCRSGMIYILLEVFTVCHESPSARDQCSIFKNKNNIYHVFPLDGRTGSLKNNSTRCGSTYL